MSENESSNAGVSGRSLGVIAALEGLEVNALSFAELRQLNAALTHVGDIVTSEIARRSSNDASGDTVKVAVPPITPPTTK
ncbi:MAG: hypothetical protein ACRES3_04840 [Steroidobacteraceae bacterium]